MLLVPDGLDPVGDYIAELANDAEAAAWRDHAAHWQHARERSAA